MNMRFEMPSMYGEQFKKPEEDKQEKDIDLAVTLIEDGAKKLFDGWDVNKVVENICEFARGQKSTVDLKNYELLKAVGNSGLLEGGKQEEILKELLGNRYGSYVESKKAEEEDPLELTEVVEEIERIEKTSIKTRHPEDADSRQAEGLRKSIAETQAEFYADTEITVKKIERFKEKFIKNGELKVDANNKELIALVNKIEDDIGILTNDRTLPDAPKIIVNQALNTYNDFLDLLGNNKIYIDKNI